MGPAFRRRMAKWTLWITPVPMSEFCLSNENAILDAWDEEMKRFAHDNLWYNRNKWLDLLARFNWKYIIWEAKFLTDFGWTQNDQLLDALTTLREPVNDGVIKVAILDLVVYIESDWKMFSQITSEELRDKNIMSALVLREFLYQI